MDRQAHCIGRWATATAPPRPAACDNQILPPPFAGAHSGEHGAGGAAPATTDRYRNFGFARSEAFGTAMTEYQ